MELTNHIPTDKRPTVGSIIVSPGCELYMLKAAREAGVSDTRPLAPILAKQVVDLVHGPYWKSEWFRSQKLHRILAFSITGEKPEQTRSVPVLAMHLPTGWTILAPEEGDLPENYDDLRLVEEVKVECFPECFSR